MGSTHVHYAPLGNLHPTPGILCAVIAPQGISVSKDPLRLSPVLEAPMPTRACSTRLDSWEIWLPIASSVRLVRAVLWAPPHQLGAYLAQLVRSPTRRHAICAGTASFSAATARHLARRVLRASFAKRAPPNQFLALPDILAMKQDCSALASAHQSPLTFGHRSAAACPSPAQLPGSIVQARCATISMAAPSRSSCRLASQHDKRVRQQSRKR